MAMQAIIDKLEDVTEAFRAEYRPGTAAEKTEGKFVLDVTPVNGFTLENVDGLKSALGAERTNRARLEAEVVKFKDLDPERARAALAELEELKKLDPTKEADKLANAKFENAKAQLLAAHNVEIKGKDDRITSLTGTVDTLLRTEQATAALAEAGGAVELLLPHVLKHTKVSEPEPGKFKVEVVDAAGNVRIADAQGTAMDIKGLVAEMKQSDAFARGFDGEGQSGSGKRPDNSGGGGGTKAKGNFGGTKQERTAAIAAKFPDLPK